MRMLKQTSLLIYALLFVTLIACQKGSTKNEDSITEQVAKIETSWDGVSAKNENVYSVVKKETKALAVDMKTAVDAVNRTYQKYLGNLGNGIVSQLRQGNWVGVIRSDVSCKGYDELWIRMDCEDDQPRTGYNETGGYYRPSWDISSNVGMRFCIVPGNNFHSYQYTNPTTGEVSDFNYAVLRVTMNFYTDAFEINKHIDNEDNNNKNDAWYGPWGKATYQIKGNASPDKSVYRTFVNDNTDLSFHVFDSRLLPTTAFTQWPDFGGLSYGVFAYSLPIVNTTDPNRYANLFIDDEDHANANYYFPDEDLTPYGYPSYATDPEGFYYYNPLNYIVGPADDNARNTQMSLAKVR